MLENNCFFSLHNRSENAREYMKDHIFELDRKLHTCYLHVHYKYVA